MQTIGLGGTTLTVECPETATWSVERKTGGRQAHLFLEQPGFEKACVAILTEGAGGIWVANPDKNPLRIKVDRKNIPLDDAIMLDGREGRVVISLEKKSIDFFSN